jgi:hypothetical protein
MLDQNASTSANREPKRLEQRGLDARIRESIRGHR